MKFATLTASGALFALGCFAALRAGTVSLHPLVTDENAVTEPALLGRWDDMTISQLHPSEYEACGKDEDELCFRFRLTRIGSELFADIQPGRVPKAGIDLSRDVIFSPMHFFARVSIQGDELRVEFMTKDWLDDQVQREGYPAHGVLDDTVVLVASSDEVKQFVGRYAFSADAFEKATVLHRGSEPAEEQ